LPTVAVPAGLLLFVTDDQEANVEATSAIEG
jgi:hypothetical protein